jgi:type IV pilus biogenesis protein PilP
MADKTTQAPNSATRQRIITIVFIGVIALIGWQVMGLFKNHKTTTITRTQTTMRSGAPGAGAVPGAPSPGPMPQVAQLAPKPPAAMTANEMEIMRLQQETEAKYIATLNQLQMLKLEQNLAETNDSIMKARLSTITSQKKIVDMLQPPVPVAPPEAYAKTLVNPTSSTMTTTTTVTAPEVVYTVISVSETQGHWNAVLGYQGKLYTVSVNDVLPADGSTVVAIRRSGVTLLKNGERKRLSLIPII